MKRIVICADGTWNVRDQIDSKTGKRRPTNVTKLARAVKSRAGGNIDQVVIYHDGIGTRGNLAKWTGGAFGEGIENNIRNLYRSVIYNYVEGDELYLFGFSRGAFTVRTLAGFMKLVGLVRKDDDYYVPDIYECYENNYVTGSAEWTKAFHNVRQVSKCPPIRFVGVWDTVGALGAPGFVGKVAALFNANKYGYHNVKLNDAIENAFHAVAIDERRGPFKPDIWDRPSDWKGNLRQAWFPGVHSDIGGGLTPDGLANCALHWIAGHAQALGLELNSEYLTFFEPHPEATLHNSMTLKYRAFPPCDRSIGEHLSAGEFVHHAAYERWNTVVSYRPRKLREFFDKVYIDPTNPPRA
jgi:uncharacterized protein (DUF2235 family)